MILSSFIIQYLFYTFLIFYYFDIINASTSDASHNSKRTTTPMDTITTNSIQTKTVKLELNTSQADQPSKSDTESLTMTENMNDNVLQTTTTVPVISEPAQSEQVKDIAESAVTSLTSSKKTIITNSPTGSITKIPVLTVINITENKINSTKTSQSSESSLPIILGSIFGGLAIIVLISSIITYVLIKQGYIQVFNQPQRRIKELK